MDRLSPQRRLLVAAGTILVLGLLIVRGPQLVQPEVLGLEDFIRYWAAGRLLAQGENPYSPALILQQEKQAGWPIERAVLMWNPPWTLPFVVPFGLLPFPLSRLLALLFQLGLLLACADWLWHYYGGPESHRWVAWLACLTFFPGLVMVRMGQVSLLLLLGVVGFLHFERRGCYGWAGITAALTIVKPHVVFLVGVAGLLWAVQQRRWAVLVGGVGAALGLGLAPLLFDPEVYAHYRYALAHDNPPTDHLTPTLGCWLRLVAGPSRFWLQCVPAAVATAWLPFYWYGRRQRWDWAAEMPVLLFTSCLTTFYGAWALDQVVLLVPVLQGAVWLFRQPQPAVVGPAIVSYLALNGLAIALNVRRVQDHLYFWLAPSLAVWSGILRARCGGSRSL